MNIKKWIASLLIVCMVSWLLPSYDVVKAAMNEQDEVDEIIEELEAELGIEIPEELEITVTEESRKSIVLDMYLDTEDLDVHVEIEFDVETEEFMVSGEETDEHGNVIHYEYDIIIHEADEDVFIATFIDLETGEIIKVDSTELQASALPVFILVAIARFGISYAIKHFGKKAIQGTITGYTRHGLAQVMGRNGRGVAVKAMNNAIKNPINIVPQSNGTVRFVGKDAVVVLNKQGKVVTAWAKNSKGVRK